MAKTKQFFLFLSAFVSAFVEIKQGKAAMLIEVRREKKKSSRFAEKIQRTERELPFCGLVEGKKKTKLGLAAVTSPDPQFVSDLCALLIEIFNLGVL